MAEVNVQRRQQERERGGEQRSQGLARRSETGLWGNPADLFSLSPFTLMRRLTEDMDRMFTGYGGGWGGRQTQEMAFIPPVEVREENNNLIVTAELPGMNKDDVRVEIQNDALIIQGERKREWDEDKGGVHRSERSYGTFYRAISLPEGSNAEQASAEFENGVLNIRIPIPQAKQTTRQIPIGGSQEQRRPAATQAAGQTQQSKAG